MDTMTDKECNCQPKDRIVNGINYDMAKRVYGDDIVDLPHECVEDKIRECLDLNQRCI
jgi:hypothetical protein